VSCLRASVCEAVGSISAGTASQTLVEHWNGTRWIIAPSANPSAHDGFNGVSCASLAACNPVGYEVVGNNVYDSLIERSA